MTRSIKALLGALAFSTFVFANQASADVLKLRVSSSSPPNSLDSVIAEKFNENIKAKLGEGLALDYFHSGALGDETVHAQQVRTGQIDVYAFGSDIVQMDKSFAVFDLPFLFKDRGVVAKVLDGDVGEKLRASLREKAGLELLAFGEIGFRQMTNNVRPIKTPADFKGMKIRVPGSPTRVLMFKTYGASPVNMSFSEVYVALQSGTVDGQENPLVDIVGQSFNEVQKYISLSNHVYTPVTLTMNKAKFDSLTPEQKQAVKAAAQEAAVAVREVGTQKDHELLKKLRDGGKIQIDEIDVAAFKKASEPLYDAVGKVAGPDLVKAMLDAVK